MTSLTEFLDGPARAIAPSLEGNDAALQALRHLLASTVGLGAAIAESRSLSRIDVRAILRSIERFIDRGA